MRRAQVSGQPWLQMMLDSITQYVIKDLFTSFSLLWFLWCLHHSKTAPLLVPRWLPASSRVQQENLSILSKSPKSHSSNYLRANADPDSIIESKGMECTDWIAKVNYITSEGRVRSTSLESYVSLKRNSCCWKCDGEF